MAFPAVQLFVERANASSGQFELDDVDAPLVAELCRRLDGIALAIELAASRVGAYGIKHTIELLSDRFRLLWEGRRTAPPRHQTLRATLDWSYNLLSEPERTTLLRLSVLVGNFTLDAARAVASADDFDDAETIASVANLVAKSILTASATGPLPQYRLLDTMRSYAREKLGTGADAEATAARHARHFLRLLEDRDDGPRRDPIPIASQLGNISAALTWCFSAQGDRATGIALAAAAMPLFLELSLLAECQAWAEPAIAALDGLDRDTRRELDLYAALGLARMWTGGTTESVESCLLHALRLAEQSNDIPNQLRLVDGLHLLHFMAGNPDGALDVARRGVAIATANNEVAALARMQVSLGVSHLLIGEVATARAHVEAALLHQRTVEPHASGHFSLDYADRARITLARILWLQGYPDQAMAMTQQAIARAIALGHPVKLTRALLWAFAVYAWNGEAQEFEDYAHRIIQDSGKHALGPFQAIGEAITGVIRAAQDRPEESLHLLRTALDRIGDHRYGPITDFAIYLAEALARTGERYCCDCGDRRGHRPRPPRQLSARAAGDAAPEGGAAACGIGAGSAAGRKPPEGVAHPRPTTSGTGLGAQDRHQPRPAVDAAGARWRRARTARAALRSVHRRVRQPPHQGGAGAARHVGPVLEPELGECRMVRRPRA